MKNFRKLVWIIAIAVVIGFGLTACKETCTEGCGNLEDDCTSAKCQSSCSQGNGCAFNDCIIRN
jgi:hypothetical protein